MIPFSILSGHKAIDYTYGVIRYHVNNEPFAVRYFSVFSGHSKKKDFITNMIEVYIPDEYFKIETFSTILDYSER